MQVLYLGGSLINYSEISIDTSILVIEEKVKKLFTVYYDAPATGPLCYKSIVLYIHIVICP